MDTLRMKSLLRQVGALAALLPLLACAHAPSGSQADSYTPQVYDQLYPIHIKPQRLVAEFDGQRGSLSAQDEDEAARFLASGFSARATDLVIAAPPTAQAVAAHLTAVAIAQGFRPEDIRTTPARGRRIAVSYTQPVAMTRDCGLWTEDSSFNPDNKLPPEFGCAMQQNLAALAANPLDLARPRYMPPHRMVLPTPAASGGTAATTSASSSSTSN